MDAALAQPKENAQRAIWAIAAAIVMIAIGIDREGRLQVLAVELANRENANSWKDFILGPRQRGLKGVEAVARDNDATKLPSESCNSRWPGQFVSRRNSFLHDAMFTCTPG